MASARIPAPGTELGPCADECKHFDCAASRQQAAQICRHCTKPIGYDTPYFRDPLISDALVHHECEYASMED